MKINGMIITLAAGTFLVDYLKQKGYQLERIAVEYNGQILTREQYETTLLQEHDTVEIVSFVGGG